MRIRSTDIIALITGLWVFVTLLLNFLIPHSWYFQYNSLTVESVVCRDETQGIRGERWSLLPVPSSGVDQIVPVGLNVPSDRLEWANGFYTQGDSTSTWRTSISVPVGTYYWESSVLRINPLYIFPVYLTAEERPISNTFTVLECS